MNRHEAHTGIQADSTIFKFIYTDFDETIKTKHNWVCPQLGL